MEPEVDTREVLGGLIEIMLNLIDNVWMRIHHIKIKKKDHTDNLKGYYD